jgi:pteridine reductase
LNSVNTQDTPTVLITGAARRIGAAIATHLHQAGFCIIIHCHQSLQEAHQLADELNIKRANSAHVYSADLCVFNDIQALIAYAIKCTGRLDGLVNNASVFEKDVRDWDRLFNTNVKAPFLLSHAAYPYLATTKGCIINITDTHATRPLRGYSVYCQTKSALQMQTQALASEFAPLVRVNAVAPGAILWPESANALNIKQQQHIIAQTPLKCHGNPVFIAQAVLALMSNPFITGQTLAVDGGRGLPCT